MNMKKLFSLALLVSAFAVVPAFAMEDEQPEAPRTEQPDAPKAKRCPLRDMDIKNCPVYQELSGIFTPVESVKNYGRFVSRLAFYNPIKTALTFALVMSIYNNIDNIKSALGLGEEEVEADAQVFADAKCGCTVEQVEEVVEVNVVEEEEETRKANA